MRGWLLALLVCGALHGQEERYRSAVLVLKDGRVIATQGEYEIFGEEIHFTYDNGELMTMPVAKVDLAETDRRNEEMKRRQSQTTPAENDLNRQVEAFQQGRSPSVTEEPDRPIVLEAPPLEESDVFQEADRRIQEFMELNQPLVYGVAAILILSALLATITLFYLMIRAYGTSAGWGLTLTVLFLAQALPVPLFLTAGASTWLHGIRFLAQPVLLSATVIYILRHCAGSRFILLLLLFGPVLVAIAILITGLIMALAG